MPASRLDAARPDRRRRSEDSWPERHIFVAEARKARRSVASRGRIPVLRPILPRSLARALQRANAPSAGNNDGRIATWKINPGRRGLANASLHELGQALPRSAVDDRKRDTALRAGSYFIRPSLEEGRSSAIRVRGEPNIASVFEAVLVNQTCRQAPIASWSKESHHAVRSARGHLHQPPGVHRAA